jgi:glycerol-3-phosphate dehydrogenase (NAD(P)+)
MGAALAINLDRSGHAVTLCATEFDAPFVEAIEKTGAHPSLALDVPQTIRIEGPTHWDEPLGASDVALLAVSSVGLRATFEGIKGSLKPGVPVLVATKGWDPETAEPLSKVLGREAEGHPIALLVGPTLAGEIASGRPTAVVCASESLDTARSLARELGSPTLRIFVTDDVAGVEVGAALKNVIAVAIGMCDGLAKMEATEWTNAKAALFSQGLVEMTRLARALGGREETVLGLTGSGDLFVTVMGGRNGKFGRLIGSGMKPDAALKQMATTVEGYEGAERAMTVAKKLGLELPLVRLVHSVLHEGADPSVALISFFATWSDETSSG